MINQELLVASHEIGKSTQSTNNDEFTGRVNIDNSSPVDKRHNTSHKESPGQSHADRISNDSTNLEYSYVIVSPEEKLGLGVDMSENLEQERPSADVSVSSDQRELTLTRSQRSNNSSDTSNITSISRGSSIQDKSKTSEKSANITDPPQGTNFPSALTNAFSSISSFTSSFSLGSSSSTINGPLNASSIINRNRRGSSANLAIETASISTRTSQITESKADIINRKAILERKNLIALTKLIVKDLISSSLEGGRTIENDCHGAIHLNNYFTLIDRVLKHGLKQNILSNRSANLWQALDGLPKYLRESTLMSESIRSLAYTKSPDGKIRAWIRLAMMQKKLPEYFNELLAQRGNLLKDIYHDFAFMLNEESHVFAGLIIGVNVIDCNFFVKDDNFDSMDEIIDLSPYLRAATNFDEDDGLENENGADELTDEAETQELEKRSTNMNKILDQKNYLEEWNKHLECTINNLQAKIRSLEENNSRLEMEAKVSEVRISKLQDRIPVDSRSTNSGGDPPTSIISSASLQLPGAIKSMINRSRQTNLEEELTRAKSTSDSSPSQIENPNHPATAENPSLQSVSEVLDVAENLSMSEEKIASDKINLDASNILIELEECKSKLSKQEKEKDSLRERVGILETSYRGALDKIRALERDLDVQTSMNSDKETTIKIYEKDIREKQQQVESLRTSLSDAKKLNSDLSERLNDTSSKLKDRLKSVTNLQTSLDKWKLENKTLAARLQDKQTELISLKKEYEKSMEQIKDLKKYNEKINDDLKKERECGQSCSVTVEEQNVKINHLSQKLKKFEKELTEAGPYKDQYETLKKRCQDYERSLEEVGAQLRESRLEVENLKEYSSIFTDSEWMDSKQVKECALCRQSFSVTRRKHHCRLCGNVFCQTCSDNKMELASSSKPARVCDTCHAFLLAKFIKSTSSSSSTSILATN